MTKNWKQKDMAKHIGKSAGKVNKFIKEIKKEFDIMKK